MDWKNKPYFGDNRDILREHVADEGVDLIYLVPPFDSNANYNVLFKEKSGEESAPWITALELLEGKKILHPKHRVETFAKAERKTKHAQEHLFSN
jgi:hypothetical protein